MIPAAVKERESAYGRAVGSAGGLETTRPSLDSTARNTNDELRVLVEIGFLASQGRLLVFRLVGEPLRRPTSRHTAAGMKRARRRLASRHSF